MRSRSFTISINCFARLLIPRSGTVWLEDKPIERDRARQLARRLTLLPQHHATPEGITVRELVSCGRSPWLSRWGRLSDADHARIDAAMRETRTESLAEKRLTALSGGQRQRVFLAMVMAQGSPEAVMQPALLQKVFHVEAEIHPEPVSGRPMCVVR